MAISNTAIRLGNSSKMSCFSSTNNISDGPLKKLTFGHSDLVIVSAGVLAGVGAGDSVVKRLRFEKTAAFEERREGKGPLSQKPTAKEEEKRWKHKISKIIIY